MERITAHDPIPDGEGNLEAGEQERLSASGPALLGVGKRDSLESGSRGEEGHGPGGITPRVGVAALGLNAQDPGGEPVGNGELVRPAPTASLS